MRAPSGSGQRGNAAVLDLQVHFLPKILEWLKGLNELPGTPALGKLDAGRIAVAGHSRGGKLAALHFASGENPSPPPPRPARTPCCVHKLVSTLLA
jgi:hypothetical protein